LQNSSNSPFNLNSSRIERRAAPRYSFLALVEAAETEGVMCIQGRLRDVSSKGCYVHTPSTFPVGTSLVVVISREGETFRSHSKVVYEHDGIGMGLVFADAGSDQLETLNSWLVRLATTDML
jgi:PilZ domain-containing protein